MTILVCPGHSPGLPILITFSLQAYLVGAGITLCLDIRHRSESESEFGDHRNLVDQVIFLLGRYDDSTLASRGIRLLSSLLKEGITKHQSPKRRARYDKDKKSLPHEGDPLAWPLEDRQSIDAICADKQPNNKDNNSLLSTTVPAAISAPREINQSSNIPVGPTVRDPGVLDIPPGQHLDNDIDFMNDDGNFVDMPWTDLCSEIFPAQSGFENAFLIEDLLT